MAGRQYFPHAFRRERTDAAPVAIWRAVPSIRRFGRPTQRSEQPADRRCTGLKPVRRFRVGVLYRPVATAECPQAAGKRIGRRKQGKPESPRPPNRGRVRPGTERRGSHADNQSVDPQAAQGAGQAEQGARHGGLSAEAGGLHPCLYDNAEEAELCAAQGGARPPDQRFRGDLLHPRAKATTCRSIPS